MIRSLSVGAYFLVCVLPADAQSLAGYCQSNVNSTGFGAKITASGSPWVADNDLTLHCHELPSQSFGFVIVSRTGANLPVANSAGILCLGGDIGRFNQSVRYTGSSNEIQASLDLTQIAHPLVPFAALEGETLRFQYYYRDPYATLGLRTNLSSGVALTFACQSVRYDSGLRI